MNEPNYGLTPVGMRFRGRIRHEMVRAEDAASFRTTYGSENWGAWWRLCNRDANCSSGIEPLSQKALTIRPPAGT